MKNRISILLVLAVTIFVALGCGSLTSRVEKSITGDDKNSTSAPNGSSPQTSSDDDADESTGVPECDQAIKTINDEIERESANSNESWAVRGTRRFMFTQMKRGLKSIIDENKADTNSNNRLNGQNIAQTCKDFQKKIDEEIKKDIANGK